MTLIAKLTATAIGAVCATAASATDYEVKRTLVLSSPAAEVWHMIGDFCDIDDWHPGVKSCSLKVIDGSLARVLATVDGDEIVQKRIGKEAGLSYTYKTITSPLPIENITGTLSIERFDKPEVSWSVRFSSDDPTMEQTVIDELETGLSAIESALEAR